ncbi:uncharacterized protein [Nicotiana sylvestris]|uniref:uncharacterized protein n=1 Tax=Nicotiana sylvestris TaxID=4096 RepID=UPI00388C82FE
MQNEHESKLTNEGHEQDSFGTIHVVGRFGKIRMRCGQPLGRCQIVPKDKDLSTQVVKIGSDGQFHEAAVHQIWSECQYLIANTQVHDLSKGEVSPGYLAWYKRSVEFERPAKRPHLQEFVEASHEQWDWLAKENEYRATISKLEKQVRDLQFENSLQAATDKGEKKKLAQENDALRAQIQEMQIAAKNPVRSAKDEILIGNLRQKVGEYGFDLNKAEGELARARTKLAKNAEERARLVKQLKGKYDNGVVGLNKKIIVLENEMTKQARDFKEEREHYYALMSPLEKDLQQLQEKNHTAEQVLDARSQQIGRLLQEKGIIRERVRRIADYIVMKCNECEDMTRSTFFASVMIFVRQIMDDLFRLQEDMEQRPAARPTGPAVDALMQVVSLFGILATQPYNTRSKDKLIMAGQELDASVIDPSREGEKSDVNMKEEIHKLKHQMTEMYQAFPITTTTKAPLPKPHKHHHPPKNSEQEEMFRKVRSLEQSFRNMQGLGGQVIIAYKDLCLFPDVQLLVGFKMPKFDLYDGHGDPMAHLRGSYSKMRGADNKDELFMAYFSHSLSGSALKWYTRQDHNRWHTWDDLAQEFACHFQYNIEIVPDRLSLTKIEKKPSESFREYGFR